MNKIFEPYTPAYVAAVDITNDRARLYAFVDTNSHRKDMAAAADEYDQLNALARDLMTAHQAADARAKLAARGIKIPGDDERFRKVYIEHRSPDDLESDGRWLDDQIVSRLEMKATPIVRKIKKALVDELKKRRPAYPRDEAALAEMLGLPESVIYSPLHTIMSEVIKAIGAEMDLPVVLRNGAPRRAVLSTYFKDPL